MRAIEIESWALRLLERVENRLPVEDSKVELKADWPDPVKAARRLAGHANAARGETILWLIGADEKQGVVNGANHQDLANWLPQVKACFESEVPAVQDLNVTYKGKTVVALCFDTSRFPYLVKNPKGGEPRYEVPWREGTAVSTATRSDLVLMLTPLNRQPRIEVLHGELTYLEHRPEPCYKFTIGLYIVPLDVPLTYPFHRCTGILNANGQIVADNIHMIIDTSEGKQKTADKLWGDRLGQRKAASGNYFPIPAPTINVHAATKVIEATADEIIIRGAGRIEIDGTAPTEVVSDCAHVQLDLTLAEAISDTKVSLSAQFKRKASEQGELLWEL